MPNKPQHLAGGIIPLAAVRSWPLPQRLGEGATDQTSYREPLPYDWTQFQTFWQGNQLPGVAMLTQGHPYYYNYAAPELFPAQRSSLAAGRRQLSAPSTAVLQERMRAAWLSPYSQIGQ